MRGQVSDEVRGRAERFGFAEKMCSYLPTASLRNVLPRLLARKDFLDMEYNMILRDPEGNWYERGMWFR
jgi:hypothetical protein